MPCHATRHLPLVLLLPLLLLGSAPTALTGQSVLDRPPNIQGTWVGEPGALQFNFVHRFTSTGDPLDKVINYPTFLLGGGLPGDLFLGLRYGSNSQLVPSTPNEWEFFARWTPFSQSEGAPLGLSLQAGYNDAARSTDGEILLTRTLADRLRLLAGARAFSNAFDQGEARWAWTAGATLELSEQVAVAGDYARLFDLEEDEGEYAWSAGLQLAIPYTPHTLSLHASNATTTTLEGASLGVSETRWGFEFTVPITLSRYFGDGGSGEAETGATADTADVGARVGMNNQLQFTPDTIRIQAGQAVVWTNSSDLLHTVTADPSRAQDTTHVRLPDGASTFDSGQMSPGESFRHTFTTPGEYRYFCVPHELQGMVGTIIVEGDG